VSSEPSPIPDRLGGILLAGTLAMATCGLVYELLAATLSSYLLGNSVAQFSLVIGVFLSSMGLGSYLSRFVKGAALPRLLAVEFLVGLIGGAMGLVGFFAFAWTSLYVPVLLGLTAVIGTLVGLEIPLVLMVLEFTRTNRINVANVLAVDYAGALAASLLFPYLLLPHLGLLQGGIVTGIANTLVGLVLLWHFRQHVGPGRRMLTFFGLSTLAVLSAALLGCESLAGFFESRLYRHPILLSQQSQYQKLVVTRRKNDVRFFLDGHLQFCSLDEYRYHEFLVHVPLRFVPQARRVLILGGGDGLAVRELRRHPGIDSIVLVDLDPAVTELFRRNPLLLELNDSSLHDPRLRIVNDDAFAFLRRDSASWDLILADLPDPSDPALAKLYSSAFYGMALSRLSSQGVLCVQSGSPWQTRRAFWSVHNTLLSLGSPDEPVHVRPMAVYLPSFGIWGFQIASRHDLDSPVAPLPPNLRFLTDSTWRSVFQLPPDMGPVPAEASTLDHPVVVDYYRADD
jgi:spermidine synthase